MQGHGFFVLYILLLSYIVLICGVMDLWIYVFMFSRWKRERTGNYMNFGKAAMFSRFLLCTVLLSAAGALCGCMQKVDYDGKEEIDKARSLHTALESATVTLTGGNESGGGNEYTQQISYRFEGDVMQYIFHAEEKKEDGTFAEYYEYNNGTEIDFITLPNDNEWRYYAKGDENFYSYTRSSRHYYADGAQLFSVFEGAISSAERDGNVITFLYDSKKLTNYDAFYGLDISDFAMIYKFDEIGRCTEFANKYVLDGEKYYYTVYITDMDAVSEIVRPEISSRVG